MRRLCSASRSVIHLRGKFTQSPLLVSPATVHASSSRSHLTFTRIQRSSGNDTSQEMIHPSSASSGEKRGDTKLSVERSHQMRTPKARLQTKVDNPIRRKLEQEHNSFADEWGFSEESMRPSFAFADLRYAADESFTSRKERKLQSRQKEKRHDPVREDMTSSSWEYRNDKFHSTMNERHTINAYAASLYPEVFHENLSLSCDHWARSLETLRHIPEGTEGIDEQADRCLRDIHLHILQTVDHSKDLPSSKNSLHTLAQRFGSSFHSPALFHQHALAREYAALKNRVHSSEDESVNINAMQLQHARKSVSITCPLFAQRFPYLRSLFRKPTKPHSLPSLQNVDTKYPTAIRPLDESCSPSFHTLVHRQRESDACYTGHTSPPEKPAHLRNQNLPVNVSPWITPKADLENDSLQLLEFFKKKIHMVLSAIRSHETPSPEVVESLTAQQDTLLQSFKQRAVPLEFLLPLGRWLVDDILVRRQLHGNGGEHKSSLDYSYLYKPVFQLLLDIFQQIRTFYKRTAIEEEQVPVKLLQQRNIQPLAARLDSRLSLMSDIFIRSIFTAEKIEELVHQVVSDFENRMRTTYLREEVKTEVNYTYEKDEYGEAVLSSCTAMVQHRKKTHVKSHEPQKKNENATWRDSIQAFSALEGFFGVFGFPALSSVMYNTESLSKLIFLLTLSHINTSFELGTAYLRKHTNLEEKVITILFEDSPTFRDTGSHHEIQPIGNIVIRLYERSNQSAKLLSKVSLLCVLFFLVNSNGTGIHELYSECFPESSAKTLHYEIVTKYLLRRGCFSWKTGLSLASVMSNGHELPAREFVEQQTAIGEKTSSLSTEEWEKVIMSATHWKDSVSTLSHLWKTQPALRSWRLCLSVLASPNLKSSVMIKSDIPESQSMRIVWNVIRRCPDIPRFARRILTSAFLSRGYWDQALIISQSKDFLSDTHWLLQSISARNSERSDQRFPYYPKAQQLEHMLCAFVSKNLPSLKGKSAEISAISFWREALKIVDMTTKIRQMWPKSRPPYHLSPYASALLHCVPGVPKNTLDSLITPTSLFDDAPLDTLLVSRMSEKQILHILGRSDDQEVSFLLTRFLSFGPHWQTGITLWHRNESFQQHGHLVELFYRKRLFRSLFSCSSRKETRNDDFSPSIEDADRVVGRASPFTTPFIHYITRSIIIPQSVKYLEGSAEPMTQTSKNFFQRHKTRQLMHSLLSHCPRGYMLFINYFLFLRNLCQWDFHDFLITFVRQESLRGKGFRPTEDFSLARKNFTQLMVANSKLPSPTAHIFDIGEWVSMNTAKSSILEELSVNFPKTSDPEDDASSEFTTSFVDMRVDAAPIELIEKTEYEVPTVPFTPTWECSLCHFSSFVRSHLKTDMKGNHSETQRILDNFARGHVDTDKYSTFQGSVAISHGPSYYIHVLASLMSTRAHCTYHPSIGVSLTPLWWWWYMVRICAPPNAPPADFCSQIIRVLWNAPLGEAKIIVWSVKKALLKIPLRSLKEFKFLRVWRVIEEFILATNDSYRQKLQTRRENSHSTSMHAPSILTLNFSLTRDRTLTNHKRKGERKHQPQSVLSRALLMRLLPSTRIATRTAEKIAFWHDSMQAFLSWTSSQGWEWEHERPSRTKIGDSHKIVSKASLELCEPLQCPLYIEHSTVLNCSASWPFVTSCQSLKTDDNGSRRERCQQSRLFSYILPAVLSNFLCTWSDTRTLCRILFGVLRTQLSGIASAKDTHIADQSSQVISELRKMTSKTDFVVFRLQLASRLHISSIMRVTRDLFSFDESALSAYLGEGFEDERSQNPRSAQNSIIRDSYQKISHKSSKYPSMMRIPHEGLRLQATAEYYLKTCINHREFIRIVFRNCRSHPALGARLVEFIIDEEKSAISQSLPSVVIQTIYVEYEKVMRSYRTPTSDFLNMNYLFPALSSGSDLPRRTLSLLRTLIILMHLQCLYVEVALPAIKYLQRTKFQETALRILAVSLSATYYHTDTWLASNLAEEHSSMRRIFGKSSALPQIGALEGANQRPLFDFRKQIIRCMRKAPLRHIDWRIALLCVTGLHPVDMLSSTKGSWVTSMHVLTKLSSHWSSDSMFLFTDEKDLRKSFTNCFLSGLARTYCAKRWSAMKSLLLFMTSEGLFDSKGVVASLARRMPLSGNKLFLLIRGLCSANSNQWTHAISVCMQNLKQCHVAAILHPLENSHVPWHICLGLLALTLAQGVNRQYIVRSHYIELLRKSVLRSKDESVRASYIPRIHPSWVVDVIPHQQIVPKFTDTALFPPFDGSARDLSHRTLGLPWIQALEKYAEFKSNRAPFIESFYLALFRCFHVSKPEITVKLYNACRQDLQSKESLLIALQSAVTQGKWQDCLRMTLNHGKLGRFVKAPLRERIVSTIIGSCENEEAFRAVLFSQTMTALEVSSISRIEWNAYIDKCAQFGRWKHLLELVMERNDPELKKNILANEGGLRSTFISALARTSPRHLHMFSQSESDFLIAVDVFFHKYGLLLQSIQSFYSISSKQTGETDLKTIRYILKHPLNRNLLEFLHGLCHHLTTAAIRRPEVTASRDAWTRLIQFLRHGIPHSIFRKFCWDPYKKHEKDRATKGSVEIKETSIAEEFEDDVDDYSQVNNATFYSSVLKSSNLPLWTPLQKCIQWCTSWSSTSSALRTVFEALTTSDQRKALNSNNSESISHIGYSRFLLRSLFSELLHWRATRHCRTSWTAALGILQETLSLWFIARSQWLTPQSPKKSDAGELRCDSSERNPYGVERISRISQVTSSLEYKRSQEEHNDLDKFFNNQEMHIPDGKFCVDADMKDEIYIACTLLLRITTCKPDDTKNRADREFNRSDFQRMLFPYRPKHNDNEQLNSAHEHCNTWLAAFVTLCTAPVTLSAANQTKLKYYHEPVEGLFCKYRFFHDFYGRLCYIVARYTPRNWERVLQLSGIAMQQNAENSAETHVTYRASMSSMSKIFEERQFHVSLTNATNIIGVLNVLRRNQLWQECISLFTNFHSCSAFSTPYSSSPFRNQKKINMQVHDIARTSRPVLRSLFDEPGCSSSILLLRQYIDPIFHEKIATMAGLPESRQSEYIKEFPLKLVLSLYRYVTKSLSLKGHWSTAVQAYVQGINSYNVFCRIFPLVRSTDTASKATTMEAQRIFATSYSDILESLSEKNDDGSHWILGLQLLQSFTSTWSIEASRGSKNHVETLRTHTFMHGGALDLRAPWKVGLHSLSVFLETLHQEKKSLGALLYEESVSFLVSKAIVSLISSHVSSGQQPSLEAVTYKHSFSVLCDVLDWRQESSFKDDCQHIEYLYSLVTFSTSKLHFYLAQYYKELTEPTTEGTETYEAAYRAQVLYFFHMARFYSFFGRNA